MMLGIYRADLHIHTCLSPCGDLDLSPAGIVEQALKRELKIIGITDHNSCENANSVIKAGKGKGLTVLPGMEITSSEEVHILALFGRYSSAQQMQELVYKHLHGENDEKIFGIQPVVTESGKVISFSPRLLIGATDLEVQDIVEQVKTLGGLAIASHVDRESFSIIGQLGFIPTDLCLDGLEIANKSNFANISEDYPNHPIIWSSDAHRLEDIGKGYTSMKLLNTTFDEIIKAFKNEERRRILPPM